jgi:hypothetical protein
MATRGCSTNHCAAAAGPVGRIVTRPSHYHQAQHLEGGVQLQMEHAVDDLLQMKKGKRAPGDGSNATRGVHGARAPLARPRGAARAEGRAPDLLRRLGRSPTPPIPPSQAGQSSARLTHRSNRGSSSCGVSPPGRTHSTRLPWASQPSRTRNTPRAYSPWNSTACGEAGRGGGEGGQQQLLITSPPEPGEKGGQG